MVAKSSVPSIVTGLEMWGQNFILDVAPAWAGKPSVLWSDGSAMLSSYGHRARSMCEAESDSMLLAGWS